MSKHEPTPRPWNTHICVDGVYAGTLSLIWGQDGEIFGPRQLGRRKDENVEANAAHIVLCVNLHDDLVALIKSFLEIALTNPKYDSWSEDMRALVAKTTKAEAE